MIPTTTPTKTSGSKDKGLLPAAPARNVVCPPPICPHSLHALACDHTHHRLVIHGIYHDTHQLSCARCTHRDMKDVRAHSASPLARWWMRIAVPKPIAHYVHRIMTPTNHKWVLPSAHPQIPTLQKNSGGAERTDSADATMRGKPTSTTMTAGAPQLEIVKKKEDPSNIGAHSSTQCAPHTLFKSQSVAPSGSLKKGGLLSLPPHHIYIDPRDPSYPSRWQPLQKVTEEKYLSSIKKNPSRQTRIHPGADRAGDLARMVATAEAKKKTEGLPPPGQDKGPLPGREGGSFQHQAPPPREEGERERGPM